MGNTTSEVLEHALNTRWPNRGLTIDEDNQCKGKENRFSQYHVRAQADSWGW